MQDKHDTRLSSLIDESFLALAYNTVMHRIRAKQVVSLAVVHLSRHCWNRECEKST
jgi:hypothetical protein